ncbi:MAG: ral nucleoside transport system permease protein [Actinomycetota bacterium]|nr:ral nucleoside transport system permease protein [Actinomycetota bacterium]
MSGTAAPPAPGAAVQTSEEPQPSGFSAGPLLVVALSFVVAMVVGALLIAVTDRPTRTATGNFFNSPGTMFSKAWHAVSSAYVALFQGAIFDPHTFGHGTVWRDFNPLSETLLNATPLILVGLSVGLAFRTGLFNIGGQGQIIMGAVLAGYVGFEWRLPPVLHVAVAVLAAVVGGAAWGGLAGWLKARTGAHEVISTIMLNYVAFNLLAYLLKTGVFHRKGSNQAISPIVHGTARLPHLFPAPLRLQFGFVIALAAAAAMTWLLNRSKTGFFLRAVGASPNAARTAGMGVGRAYIVAMVIAGGLAGLAGASQILGTSFALTTSIDANFGFDGITVALLGRAKPWPTVAAGVLFGALRAGSVTMQTRTGTSIDLVTVLQSLVVLFVAAPMFVRHVFRLRAAGDAGSQQLAKGWNG